jgi:hypothetical protein
MNEPVPPHDEHDASGHSEPERSGGKGSRSLHEESLDRSGRFTTPDPRDTQNEWFPEQPPSPFDLLYRIGPAKSSLLCGLVSLVLFISPSGEYCGILQLVGLFGILCGVFALIKRVHVWLAIPGILMNLAPLVYVVGAILTQLAD